MVCHLALFYVVLAEHHTTKALLEVYWLHAEEKNIQKKAWTCETFRRNLKKNFAFRQTFGWRTGVYISEYKPQQQRMHL